jgi:hypothetical protein
MWLGLGRELQSVAAWLLKMNDFVCNFLHGKKMILYLRDTCPYITEFRFHPFSSRQTPNIWRPIHYKKISI